MSIRSNLTKTLTMGEETLLFRARVRPCRITLTGLSGEGTAIRFRTRTHGVVDSGLFEATEVKLSLFDTVPMATVLATTPDGVASLDIVYELRTGTDA
jgi:hypothetical protein